MEGGTMRSALLAVLALLVAAPPLSAEICVRHHTHTDEYYYGGSTTPEVDREYEIWFGDGRIAYVQENVKMIVNVSAGTFTFVGLSDSMWVRAPLPMAWDSILAEAELSRVMMYQYTGELKEPGEVKELDGRRCTPRMLLTWIPFEEEIYNETDEVIWYTDDVPVDLSLYAKVLPCLLTLRNYKPELIETLAAEARYPARTESTRFMKGFGVTTVDTITEIREVDAPEGLWDVPDGFTKRDRLTIRDLQAL